MSYDKTKSAAKAKRTRNANVKAKKASDKKHSAALSRARNAENKLKWYIKGREDESAARNR
ncbi:unnamed protein product [marine sediment metagenome]|uniref:Uncharacterized protein n=1 Tax=marine sediment metagenome TaxID=412755 RepID=X1F8Q7_9ZZZZ